MTERIRGSVHFFAGGLFFALGLYNALRACETRERRNVLNAAVYTAMVAWEAENTRRHWSR